MRTLSFARTLRFLLTFVLICAAAQGQAMQIVTLNPGGEGGEPAPAGSFAALIAGIETAQAAGTIRTDRGRRSEARQPLLVLADRRAVAPLLLAAADGPIAVLYPDIGEPYLSVFSTIIEGIENETRNKVARFAIGNSFDALALSNELKRQDVRVVIALGRNGLKAANALDKDFGVVAGGILSAVDGTEMRGTLLSLAPDPALLFERLKALFPDSRRIVVVYEPRQNGWLIELAHAAARNLGMELVALEAPDIKAAAEHYRDFFATADARRDALWLPQDSVTANDSTILPLVLQESWSKGVAVFSSSAPHVQRGVLFALYPNNVELGRKLAASALSAAAGAPPERAVLPLRDVLAAFNTRTARRLGLDATARGFDLIFPR